MKNTIHLVLDTPGANASKILFDATRGDNPEPLFLHPENSSSDLSDWAFSKENKIMNFSIEQKKSPTEVFLFLSLNISLADQIEATLHTLRERDDFTIGRFILFIYSPILLDPPLGFQDWLDGVVHFTDVTLFTGRSNDNASAIKMVQDRYKSMYYPMETYILAKKNNPWAHILDSTPRRISHVFDDPVLLEPEDLPENDRYLANLASGQRQKEIPQIFDQS